MKVIVERSFEEPVEFAALQAIEDRGAWCLDAHRVRFLRTWFSKDRRRMICLYEAPDAESVRIAQRKAAMPLDRAWSAEIFPAPEEAPGPPAGAAELVLVERTFEEPMSADNIGSSFSRSAPCFQRHDVGYLGGYISPDGLRMVCVFRAPDAESVRIANRQAGAPFDRAWSATLHEPPGGRSA